MRYDGANVQQLTDNQWEDDGPPGIIDSADDDTWYTIMEQRTGMTIRPKA